MIISFVKRLHEEKTLLMIKAKVDKAIKNIRMKDLLLGKADYKCELSEFIPVNMPTDWPNIIRYIYINYENNKNCKKLYEAALFEILKGDYYELYCGTMIVFLQIMNEHENNSPFTIQTDRCIELIKEGVDKKREELCASKEWTGYLFPDGLYGDIKRIDMILQEDYGISILNN